MTKILNFNNYSNRDVLYIFDMDDTIVKAPSFEEMAIKFLKEDVTIKEILNDSVSKIGVNLNDLKWENGRIFIEDPNLIKTPFGNWVRKGSRIYLTSPELFYETDMSLPTGVKELSELYNSVENKCIVTARWESCRSRIEKKLSEFGLQTPKYGLHMAPVHTKNAGEWKGYEIVKILKKTGFTKAKFYDDNSKYLRRATRVIHREMPNVIWEPIKVY